MIEVAGGLRFPATKNTSSISQISEDEEQKAAPPKPDPTISVLATSKGDLLASFLIRIRTPRRSR